MPTLLLTRSDVERLLEPAALADELRVAFRAYSAMTGPRAQRVRAALPGTPRAST